MTPPDVPILMYHQVAPEGPDAFRKYFVTPKVFRSQMAWLRRTGYVPITLDALRDARAGRGSLPARPVIITFDDGFQACIDHAVPILEDEGFTAVFYLVAGLMGKMSSWLIAERGCAFPLVDWRTARQLQAAGFQCGAHTMSHPRLTTLSPDACLDELLETRHRMEDRLSSPIRHLAYPFGDYDAHVRTLAEEAGYETACSVRIGLSRPDDDMLALHRVPVNGGESLLDFMSRLKTADTLSGNLRRMTTSIREEKIRRRRPQ